MTARKSSENPGAGLALQHSRTIPECWIARPDPVHTSGPSLNNIVFTAFYAAYMVVGGYFEERRMVRIFGDDYRAYQRQVPPFLPRPWRLLES